MARPRKEIDEEQVYKLARLGCTQEEIGEWFGVDHSTISRRFAQEFSLGYADCKTSIRRWQMKAAHGGSVPMLIHLGKNMLGQSDKTDITSKGDAVGATVILLPPKELHADDQANGTTSNDLPSE